MKDNTTAQYDALPVSNLQKNKVKTQSPRLLNLTKTIAHNTAQVMILEVFETTFRSEWKQKKESVLQRHDFIERKKTEFEKIRKDYREGWKQLSLAAGLRFAEQD